jgi:hypothetical protein
MTVKIRSIRPPLVAALVVVAATPAAALAEGAAPQAVTITTQVVFDPNISGTFTATGPICASGTVEYVRDRVSAPPGFNVNGWTRFICDDNSGSFVIHLQAQTAQRPKEGFDLDGPWTLSMREATGGYQKLSGYGWFGVVLDFSTDPIEGVETYVGFVNP